MSILTTIQRLIKGSPDAETATRQLMEVLAREAIKTGDPDALVSVAAQWQELLEGRPALPASPASSNPLYRITPPEALRDHVLAVMRAAWSSGLAEVTTGTIQKGVDRLVKLNSGWTDADLEDVSDRPGIQHRWKVTLSTCLRDMRNAGEVRNDPKAWKTYTLAPHMRKSLPSAAPAEPPVLAPATPRSDFEPEPGWEFVPAE